VSLLSARAAVIFPAKEHHRPLTSTKLYCLVTEAHKCEQLPKVVTQLCPGGNQVQDLVITGPMPFCASYFPALSNKGKGKVHPYSLQSVGPGADPGVPAVSPQVTF